MPSPPSPAAPAAGAVAAPAQGTSRVPRVPLSTLEVVWFQVGGTVCNLACTHCFVSCSPTNRTHEPMSLAQVVPHLEEAAALGVREYYFTGGEPFLAPDMEAILELVTGRYGAATVLTNGLLLSPERCARLQRIAAAATYSLDLRVSLDGADAATHDSLRGPGTFARTLAGIRNLAAVGLEPVITATAPDAAAGEDPTAPYFALLRELGIARPRLKVLPLFKLGAEAERSGAYASWQRLAEGDATGWEHLQCSASRMVTASGVWVCPILVNEPAARMGERLSDTLRPFPLAHGACWTCHVHGVSCRT